MKRVKVDFSTTVRGGLIRANQRRASEPLEVGDRVEAIDLAEGMQFFGVVEETDEQFAYLRMEWEPIPVEYASPISVVTELLPTGGRQVPREDLILSAAM